VVALGDDLDAGQSTKLVESVDKCPVHRTLTSEIDIRTREERVA